MNYQPKPLFLKRMSYLLKNKKDLSNFLTTLKTKPLKSIRVNTLKISPQELIKKLPKSWNQQPIVRFELTSQQAAGYVD